MNQNFMKYAIDEAKKAYNKGEIPVGAIIVKNNKIIASSHNLKETNNNPLHHAEILAIKEAVKITKNWRLNDCDMYVTLEPCVMCAGAILNARIRNLYFGAYDYKFGACFSNDNIFITNKNMCSTTVYGGIMEEECKKIIDEFFNSIR
ncbi:MAG: nucleoside deaminase [Ruminococcaceae bacterium]|nr:nucleoside deaminase [Oscillospiraceae bacterium]